MAKDKLGFVRIDVRDGMPLSVREENPTRDDGMNMRVPALRRLDEASGQKPDRRH